METFAAAAGVAAAGSTATELVRLAAPESPAPFTTVPASAVMFLLPTLT